MPLVLNLEAQTHEELVSLAIRTLGIKAVEKIVPQPTATEVIAASNPPPAATLPVPEARPTRKKREAAPTPPVAAPAALSTPAPAAAPAVTVPQAPVAKAQPAVPGVSSPANTDFLTPPAASPAPVVSTAAVPSAEETRAALHLLNGTAGGTAAVDMLKKYGVDRISTVPETRRAEFIAECKADAAKAEAAKKS